MDKVFDEMLLRANKRSYVGSEDKKLELRLAPPGEDQSHLSLEAKRVCHESEQKSKSKIAQAPVVGWPPIRSSRKNLAAKSSSLGKSANSESPIETLKQVINPTGKSSDNTASKQHMFVKINMEGVPIGRKINLKAYDSYEKLSFAIDDLFQGLLAAQRVCSDVEKENKKEDMKSICESLHGNGEYTLLYEDHEGDRMLVGDVPWNMFVSTAKRLRVLKSSELSTLQLSSSQHEKTPLDSTMEVGIGR